jgi:hypothetical protein
MTSAPEVLKITSTTILDAFAGRMIATGLEMIFPEYDPAKAITTTVIEAAAQLAATGLLSVQLSRFLYTAETVDATAGAGMMIFLWEQPGLKRKVAGVEERILSSTLSPALGAAAASKRGAGRSGLQPRYMSK